MSTWICQLYAQCFLHLSNTEKWANMCPSVQLCCKFTSACSPTRMFSINIQVHLEAKTLKNSSRGYTRSGMVSGSGTRWHKLTSHASGISSSPLCRVSLSFSKQPKAVPCSPIVGSRRRRTLSLTASEDWINQNNTAWVLKAKLTVVWNAPHAETVSTAYHGNRNRIGASLQKNHNVEAAPIMQEPGEKPIWTQRWLGL